MDKYDVLKLDNQLCFPLYAASKEVIRLYRPFLEKLDLTYTQYIAMMVLWENREVNVKKLGERLFLDSGTLTPVLKSLEAKGYLKRHRSSEDERVLLATVTDEGMRMREKALAVPGEVASCVSLSVEEAVTLKSILVKLLGSFSACDDSGR